MIEVDYRYIAMDFGEICVWQEQEDSYEGDTLCLLRNFPKSEPKIIFGLLQFGWGSCSGCDALKACNNFGELIQLRDSLYQSIEWHDSLQEVLRSLEKKKETPNKWYLDNDLFDSFFEAVKVYVQREGFYEQI